jgi:hypothetical protein
VTDVGQADVGRPQASAARAEEFAELRLGVHALIVARGSEPEVGR